MRIVRIDSLDAPELADYSRLTDVVLRRVSEPAGGLYIAESTKVIERALQAGHRPRSVLLLEQWLPDIEPLLRDHDVPVFVGESALLEGLTGFNLHRGALSSMHRPPLRPVDELVADARRIVILEDIVDQSNNCYDKAAFLKSAFSRCRAESHFKISDPGGGIGGAYGHRAATGTWEFTKCFLSGLR